MADSPKLYVAVLDTHNVFDSPYEYHTSMNFEWEPDLALESLAKNLRSFLKASESEDFTFFKLDDPVVANSAKDFKEICDATLPDYECLNDIVIPYCDGAILGTLDLPGIEDTRSKVLVLVALRTRPLPTSTSMRPVLDSFDEDVYDREAIARAAQHRPPPSIGARNTELMYSQLPERLDAAYNYRPPELAPPPIAIYHPAFARFRREMAIPTEDIEFSQSELTQSSHFVDVSLRLYPDYPARFNALRDTFVVQGAPLWTSIRVRVNDGSVWPCGCLPIYGPNWGRLFPCLADLNGSKGCDSSDEVQAIYTKIVSSEQYYRVRQVSCCPAFLVSLSGHVLSIWGAVFADRFFFERLALLYVGPQPPTSYSSNRPRHSDMVVGILQIAKLIRSLDNCLGDLVAHYNNLKPPSPYTFGADSLNRHLESSRTPDQIATHFIHWTSFISQGKEHHLVYGQRLGHYINSAVFRAHMSFKSGDEEEHHDVVVKFAHHYGEAGHRLLAEANLAPTLYYCAFEETVGMWAIVMSYIDGSTSITLEKGQIKALSRAVDLLHANDLVCGDLRRPNIIATKPDGISLIDFEWCGSCKDVREGDMVIWHRMRYPADILMDGRIDWAPGVGPNQVIAKEHDRYRLEKFFV